MINKKKLYIRAVTAGIFGAVVIFLLNFNYWSAFAFLILVSFLTTYEYIKLQAGSEFNFFLLLISSFLFGPELTILNEFWRPFNSNIFIVILFIVLLYQLILILNLFSDKYLNSYSRLLVYMRGLLYIGIPVALFHEIVMKEYGDIGMIFILILLIWTNDTFAYLTGSIFGKHKLMPSVSPAKTIEGFIGGGLFTIIAAFIISLFYNWGNIYFYILLAIIVWLMGTLGDLVESKMKRSLGVKDSGDIMPGHGGFLDRFDSFIFVLPWVALLFYIGVFMKIIN